MKAILTKRQVEMLLDGKDLTYGRRRIAIQQDGKVADALRLWLNDHELQERFCVVVDTNELSIDFRRKEGAEQECL